MKPGPRALYVEIKRRYNGQNNGEIVLSHRQAADALNVNRNTVGAYFEELQERGFIWMTQAPYLGPSGIGRASIWAISKMPTTDLKPARKSFMRWSEEQNPRKKNRTNRPKKQDTVAGEAPENTLRVLKIVT